MPAFPTAPADSQERPASPGAAEPRPPAARRAVGLYPLLVSLPVIVVLPLLMFSGVLLHLMGEQTRAATARELSATNRAMAASVERELSHVRQALRLVAESPGLEAGRIDLPYLAAQIREVTRADLGLQTLSVVAPDGRVLLEYPPAAGGPGRIPLGDHHRKVFETNQVVISDLHASGSDGRLAISVNYPVWRAGRILWLVSARLDPVHLAGIMGSHIAGRDSAVATLLDGRYRILARTREMDRFLGAMPSEETLRAVTSRDTGVRRFPTRDGNEYLWAWATTIDGWIALTGIPARAADAALQESLLRLAGVGLALLLVGLSASLLLARRIVRTVDRMATDAPRLARGEAPPGRRSGVRQLDALRDALVSAGRHVVRALADRDQALEAERVARALADEDNRAKDIFIATLSHELRNPLSPIRAAAAVLRSPQADEARRAWAVSVIERQSAAMARLLEDLLDIARINSGRILLEREPTDLGRVLESAIEVARPLIEQRAHTLQVRLPDPPVTLDADPLRLSQVFANLLTNAAKYTDPGGLVEVFTEATPAEVRVTVRDNGIGLEPQALEQVFQRFAQVRGSLDRAQGGLGIGLSLVRGLVRLHGGWVRAHSAGLGRGSTFVVGLPLQPQPA
ncbi:ATP-binding protein [Ramlibacter sp. MAHUQ-53]|uniref:sensor histidine kinase n=1 Tax=unclassified Ramlibacter TaxID=2617605 RepID=UPI003628B064